MKTTVTNITATIKKVFDYNITDPDGIDDLILESLNLFLPIMKQWFMDESLFDEIGTEDTFDTVGDQEYIELGTTTPDFDQQIVLTERTNDTSITIISFKEYKESFPDPSANKSETADVAAFFANRIYFGPTPSITGITYYLNYIALTTILVDGSTLPYEHKYNALVVAGIIEYLTRWLDKANVNAIALAERNVLKIKQQLIVEASKNIGMNRQVHSRREGDVPFFSPRRVIT